MTVSAKTLDILINIGSNIWNNISNMESFQEGNWGRINYLIMSNGTRDTLLWIN